MRDFESFFAQATGHQPYGYQERLAKHGLPDAFWAPTGTGKTGLILAWLWRRLHGPDRAATPRRLVYALSQRAVLDEVSGLAATWLENLGLTGEVALHVVLGDRGTSTGDWRENMHQPAIVVGTAETLVSKALLRGYGVGATMHPIDFALVTNGVQWVIDEAGLCPAATRTLRQLAGWAREWGTAEPFWLTCLSSLAGGGGPAGETIAPRERVGELAVRLRAARVIRQAAVGPGDYQALADAVRELHRAGTTTLAVLNTVRGAQEVYRSLRDRTVACTLLHSQLRSVERVACLADVAASPSDRIVVATGDIAATLDLSAAVLVTEAAPWPSMVRRAGRCNRTGTVAGAEVWWAPPAAPRAAERLAIDAACAELSRLEGVAVTGEDLAAREALFAVDQAPGLGLAEFSALFDTSPAASGLAVDVARHTRDAADLDVDVAWVTWTPGPDGAPDPEVRYPAPEYRCRVPIEQAVKLAESRPVWRIDYEAGEWRRAANDPQWRPRPFELLLVNAADGGYDPSAGFDLASWTPVAGSPELLTPDEVAGRAAAEAAALGTDPLVQATRPWQSLDEHSRQVRDQCAALLAVLRPAISPEAARAALIAAYAHDVGKAHPIWQDALCALAAESDAETVAVGRPWAKSGTTGALHFAGEVRFRHELASMLLIDGPLHDILAATPEKDLARYLVLAHHGQLRVRVGNHSDLVNEPKDTEITSEILGLKQGATSDIPPMLGHPATTLTVDLAQFASGGTRSWTTAVAALRDRFGPFTLAYLETVVRISDWRGSGARELATNTDAIDIRAKVPQMGDTGFEPPLQAF
jgi:CRISPR-associated endonuclease/helicase Cas3